MSGPGQPLWRVVAEREVATKLRDKTFLGTTAFTLVLLVGAVVLISVLGSRAASWGVAVTTPSGTQLVDSAQSLARRTTGPETTLTARRVTTPAQARALVGSGDVDAAVVPVGGDLVLVGNKQVDPDLQAVLRAAQGADALAANARAAGVDPAALQRGAALPTRLLAAGPVDAQARYGVSVAFAVIFLMTGLSFGMTIAQSVVIEKESRIVEILAAAVPIRTLLWGKVLGNTLLALGQIVLLTAVGLVGLAVTGQGTLLSGISAAAAWYVTLFVLGFISLASLWSVAGSLASRQQDLQSTTLPGQLLLIVPYFVAVSAGEGVRTVFSMLPIVSTMIMPGRIAQGDVPLWQIGVAITTTILAAVLFVRIGERLYERTLLHTGGKLGYREAFGLSSS